MGPRVVVPATHEPVDLVRLVRQAELETRGILITQEGAPKAVLLSVEEYARLTSDEAAQAGEGNNRWVVWLAKAAKLRAEMLARRGGSPVDSQVLDEAWRAAKNELEERDHRYTDS